MASELQASDGRILHIGRVSDESDKTTPSLANGSSSAPVSSTTPLKPSTLEMVPASSELDESRWDVDEDVVMEVYHGQISPVRKRTTRSRRTLDTIERKSSKSLHFSGAISPPVQDDGDSVISNSPTPVKAKTIVVNQATDVAQTPLNSTPNAPSTEGSGKKFTNRFTTQEDHLLIFLKEVKKLKWLEIEQHFPNRKVYTLQTRYSQKLNRRNRALDPPAWDLPPQYTTEGGLDLSVHGQTAQSRSDALASRSATQEEQAQLQYHSTAMPASTSHHLPSDHKFGNWLPRRRGPGRPRKDEVLRYSQNEPSSGNESPAHYRLGRPRRNVQKVNYTWPRQRQALHEDSADEVSAHLDSSNASIPFRSSEPSAEPSVGLETVIPVDKPMSTDFDEEDASLVTSGQNLPYISYLERAVVRQGSTNGEWDQLWGRDWQGTIVHVDFSHDELDVVERVIDKALKSSQIAPFKSRRRRLYRLLRDQPEHKSLQIAYGIRRKLHTRSQESINAFIQDARDGKLHGSPHIARLGAVRVNRQFSSAPKLSTCSFIRQRELGLQSRRGWKASSQPLFYQLKNKIYDSLGPAYSYTGASSDVHTVAWDPSGQCFAAGAVCVTDPDSMQYNRPNNLLYGDVSKKVIHELAEHNVPRPKTDSGPNSTHAMYVSQNPKLFTTVSTVAFSPNGQYMFSAGYDNHAFIWRTKTNGSQPELICGLRHKAEVDILTVSCEGLFATVTKKRKNAVKVVSINDDGGIEKQTYSSRKADERPDQNILPTALQFEPNHGRLLLAGFGANKREDHLDTSGDICLWDIQEQKELFIHGSTKNVFDVAFHPTQAPLFAVGCVAGQNVNRGTRSLLRFYDGRGHEKRTMVMEIECLALDMNDVVFCPYDENLIAAGCTSGRTYIWDVRRPGSFLYSLSHGKSLMPLDDYQDREVTDTGVRFLSWGDNATRLYTGSSDGVVKVWDVARAQEDVFIKDLITVDSGIMSGAFSLDKDRLVVGEVNGSINVLEVGKDDYSVRDMEKLKHIPYEDPDASETDATVDAESGRAVASQLLATGEIVNVPFGGLPIRQAVQGPSYAGPFDSSVDAPFLREQALEFQYSLAKTPGPQCDISSCKDSIVQITSEENGDSGRSGDRIPDELRKQRSIVPNDLAVISGKSRCTSCGCPARPTTSTTAEADEILCERCSFACFRCGGTIKVEPTTTRLVCRTCLRVWEIGALGYECIDETGCRILSTHVPTLEGYKKNIAETNGLVETNASFGDEMNALTDYYYSLAIDRPESPPL